MPPRGTKNSLKTAFHVRLDVYLIIRSEKHRILPCSASRYRKTRNLLIDRSAADRVGTALPKDYRLANGETLTQGTVQGLREKYGVVWTVRADREGKLRIL